MSAYKEFKFKPAPWLPHSDLPLEVFIHGGMCANYSGRCTLSNHLTLRDANRGGCAQSCRWSYHLMEEKRPGEFFPVEEDDRGATILSSRDLNCLDFLDQIAEAGVVSFKLEGRMKSPYYVATVTNAYRRRLDGILKGDMTPRALALLRRELDAASHRVYSSGFYFGELTHSAPDEGVYRRYYNRKDMIDGTSGKNYDVENVIVMYADYSWYDGASDRPIVALTGTNKCEYFIGGKHFTGTWTRSSVSESTSYLDDEGNVVAFKPGKTFIQIVKPSIELEIVR